MITFNNIVSKFEDFCADHFFIKTFSYGSPSDVDLDKFEQYPLLHLVYTGGDYNSPKAKTYNLEVYILSLPPSEADKVEYQKESISDAERVAEDILADIQNGGNIFSFGYQYELLNASVTPLEETQSNALAGCLLDIAISVPYTYDSCNAPLSGVEPEGSTTPSYKARGLLRVRELDGSPDVLSVATINVPNGSLTDDGNGEITLDFATGPAGDSTRLVQTVKNVSGGELTKGTPVHAVLDGASGNLAYVIAARADTPSAMPATFVLNETLADEAEGEAIITGLISGVDTDAFQPGDVLYVGATGGYTNVKPTGTNLIQNLGIVLKKHPSNGSGIVYGAGRSNDVPNLADGHFFIGSSTNTQESTYGLPTSDPANNETLVFNTSTDSFEAGYPVASGQVSTFVANSTFVQNITTTGVVNINLGSVLGGTLSYDSEYRAGWNMGLNLGATQLLGAPVAVGSTMSISFSVDITAPVGALATLDLQNKTGWFTAPSVTGSTIIGNGVKTTYTITSTTGTVYFWQLANTANLALTILVNPGTIVVEPDTLTITITHA